MSTRYGPDQPGWDRATNEWTTETSDTMHVPPSTIFGTHVDDSTYGSTYGSVLPMSPRVSDRSPHLPEFSDGSTSFAHEERAHSGHGSRDFTTRGPSTRSTYRTPYGPTPVVTQLPISPDVMNATYRLQLAPYQMQQPHATSNGISALPLSAQRSHRLGYSTESESDMIVAHFLASGRFKCADLMCEELRFGRQADLRRHLQNVHGSYKREYFCVVAGCDRSKKPSKGGKGHGFGFRKDKFDEHIRTIHLDIPRSRKTSDDIGSACGKQDEELRVEVGVEACPMQPKTTGTTEAAPTNYRPPNVQVVDIDPGGKKFTVTRSHETESAREHRTEMELSKVKSGPYIKKEAAKRTERVSEDRSSHQETPNNRYPSPDLRYETEGSQSDATTVSLQNFGDGIEAYSVALKYFGLCDDSKALRDPDSNSQASRGDENQSGTEKSTSTMSSSSVPVNALTARSDTNIANSSSDSLKGNQVAIETKDRVSPDSRPLDLLCWHAANDIKCKGKIGRSPKTRHLYKDHSLSASSNTHRLPPPCSRCDILFPDAKTAAEHKVTMRSKDSCPTFSEEEVTARNTVVERLGLTKSNEDAIADALKRFRGGQKSLSVPTLPEGCDQDHFTAWVARNIPLYIGNSNIKHSVAAKELSEWYICFSVIFPGQEIPSNPFAQSPDSRYRRLRVLIELGLAQGSANGLVPQLSDEHYNGFRTIFNKAVHDLEAELLVEESRVGSCKGPPRKRRRVDDTEAMDQSLNSFSAPPTPGHSYTNNGFAQQPNSCVPSIEADSCIMGPPPVPDSSFCEETGLNFDDFDMSPWVSEQEL